MKDLKEIQTNLKAPKGQYNAFGKYAYRSCEDILETVKPLLSDLKCTLTISDKVVNIGERYYVESTCHFENSDGESFSVSAYAREAETKKGMDSAQITGAASSYARKYALNGLFLIDDTKDADATNDHGKGSQDAEKPKNPPVNMDAFCSDKAIKFICKFDSEEDLLTEIRQSKYVSKDDEFVLRNLWLDNKGDAL